MRHHLCRIDLVGLKGKHFKLHVDLGHRDGHKSDYVFEAISVVHVHDSGSPITAGVVPPMQKKERIVNAGLVMQTKIDPQRSFTL